MIRLTAKKMGLPGTLRIIGGEFRGRRLPVLDRPDLRPTPDRVRETLFNWLMPVISGARCLDLFAGSGALGFEAASRGAQRVTMIDRSAAVVRVLNDNVRLLKASQVNVIQANAFDWLRSGALPFDLVFLDPPFSANLLGRTCDDLHRGGWLAKKAWVYLEAPESSGLPDLPPEWTLIREKRAGSVSFRLAETG